MKSTYKFGLVGLLALAFAPIGCAASADGENESQDTSVASADGENESQDTSVASDATGTVEQAASACGFYTSGSSAYYHNCSPYCLKIKANIQCIPDQNYNVAAGSTKHLGGTGICGTKGASVVGWCWE